MEASTAWSGDQPRSEQKGAAGGRLRSHEEGGSAGSAYVYRTGLECYPTIAAPLFKRFSSFDGRLGSRGRAQGPSSATARAEAASNSNPRPASNVGEAAAASSVPATLAKQRSHACRDIEAAAESLPSADDGTNPSNAGAKPESGVCSP